MLSEIRKLDDSDFDDFVEIWCRAYPGTYDTATEEMKHRIKERWVKSNKESQVENFYGAFRNNKLLGGMILFNHRMNIHSIITPIGGVGQVCVDSLHKKEQVGKDLMSFSLQHFYERGICLTTLYPFSSEFYAKMGYGLGSKVHQYRFEPKGLPRTSKKHVNYLEIKDIKLVTDCFNRCASSRHGLMLRSEDRFDRIFQRNYVVGYKKNGHVLGYVVFHFQDKENYLRYNLTIEELIYETPEALSEILTFLNTQQDQINKVVFNTPDNNFYLLLSDPRSRENKSLFLNSQETNISGVGAMYRVINVPEFFLNLNTHNFGDQTLKLRIDIQDSFLMENNRSILIHFKNGKPNVIEDSDDYEVSISLDIARFSSMVMGAISFKKLYSYSLVEISKTEFIDSINKVFLCEEPPMTFDEC